MEDYTGKLNKFILESKIVKASLKEFQTVKVGEGTETCRDLFIPVVYVFFEKSKSKMKVISLTGRWESDGFRIGKPFDTLYAPAEYRNYLKKYKIIFNKEMNLAEFMNTLI